MIIKEIQKLSFVHITLALGTNTLLVFIFIFGEYLMKFAQFPRHNICHTSPPTEDGPADLPAEIPLSAPANFRHLSLQEFHTDKAEEETCGRYKHFSSEESSRHSSTSSQVREEARDRDDGDDCDEGDEAVEHGDDDNIFEDNQPLLKCPETKEVLREKKSK